MGKRKRNNKANRSEDARPDLTAMGWAPAEEEKRGLAGFADKLEDFRDAGGLGGLVGDIHVEHSVAPGAGLDPVAWAQEHPVPAAIGLLLAALAVKKLVS